jgi:hypothetical protein
MPIRSGYPCCPNGSHVLCRYAHHIYKPRYACFRCRKAFKRRFQDDVDPGGESRPPCCPECGGEVFDLGVGFVPPRRQQVVQWRRLEALARAGAKFSCCGGTWLPRTAIDHHLLLARRRQRSRLR